MHLKDIRDPEVDIFLTYSYEREKVVRRAWLENHKDIIKRACSLGRIPKNNTQSDNIELVLIQRVEALRRDFIEEKRHGRKTQPRDGTFIAGVNDLKQGHSIVALGLGDPKEDPRLTRPNTDLSIDPVMRPVDPEVKKILYNPDDFGRLQYLHKRYELSPEKKYYLRDCTYWEHGWKFHESPLLEKCEYGNLDVLVKDFSRSGAQPDPYHYAKPCVRYKCFKFT